MLHIYDTRWATYQPDGTSRLLTEQEKAARVSPLPRYWVAETEIDNKVGGRWEENWFLGWRDVCRSTDVRTVIATLVPRLACGHKWMLCLPSRGRVELQALWSSFAFDYVARQKLGGTSMTHSTIMQLPMPDTEQLGTAPLPLDRPFLSWLGLRVDRLNGWIVDESERARVRAELDAAAFHLYGLGRQEVSHVMDTFPIVKRKDEAAFGTYRTKELILSVYDAMADARSSSSTYQPPWRPQEVSA